MKKLLSFITILFCIVEVTFSEAPELKNMMPNSWQKLTKLTVQEESDFLASDQIKNDTKNLKSESWTTANFVPVETRVYKESANGIEFYRVLYCNQKMSDFLSAEYKDITMTKDEYAKLEHSSILQNVYFGKKNNELIKFKTLQYRTYGIAEGNMETKGCEYFVFNDLFIKELNSKEIGFFITEVSTGYQIYHKDNTVTIEYTKLKTLNTAITIIKLIKTT